MWRTVLANECIRKDQDQEARRVGRNVGFVTRAIVHTVLVIASRGEILGNMKLGDANPALGRATLLSS